jgi:hypothetical protein
MQRTQREAGQLREGETRLEKARQLKADDSRLAEALQRLRVPRRTGRPKLSGGTCSDRHWTGDCCRK